MFKIEILNNYNNDLFNQLKQLIERFAIDVEDYYLIYFMKIFQIGLKKKMLKLKEQQQEKICTKI
ncbi:MAG: hypothetical protein J5507_04965 [Clostridia bacterium]|nr:hypothetical protein [Clostridia bacterium]